MQRKELYGSQAIAQKEVNSASRFKAYPLAAAAIVFLAIIILIIVQSGLGTQLYSEASRYESQAWVFGYGIALVTGILAAFITAHPVRLNNPPHNMIATIAVVLGILLGVVPGFVILLLYLLYRAKLRHDHPVTTQNAVLRPAHIVVVVASFFVGLIPGFILAYVLIYPLSKHACELSGSKYC